RHPFSFPVGLVPGISQFDCRFALTHREQRTAAPGSEHRFLTRLLSSWYPAARAAGARFLRSSPSTTSGSVTDVGLLSQNSTGKFIPASRNFSIMPTAASGTSTRFKRIGIHENATVLIGVQKLHSVALHRKIV